MSEWKCLRCNAVLPGVPSADIEELLNKQLTCECGAVTTFSRGEDDEAINVWCWPLITCELTPPDSAPSPAAKPRR